MHAPGQDGEASRWGKRHIEYYNRQKDMNEHNCHYKFVIKSFI